MKRITIKNQRLGVFWQLQIHRDLLCGVVFSRTWSPQFQFQFERIRCVTVSVVCNIAYYKLQNLNFNIIHICSLLIEKMHRTIFMYVFFCVCKSFIILSLSLRICLSCYGFVSFFYVLSPSHIAMLFCKYTQSPFITHFGWKKQSHHCVTAFFCFYFGFW